LKEKEYEIQSKKILQHNEDITGGKYDPEKEFEERFYSEFDTT